MSSFKFKFFFFVVSLLMTLNVNASFDEMECLNSNFSTTVSHKGQPFGMTENVITVSKENCKVTIEHKKLKFMKNKYVVDVCRAPVHIKSGSGAIEVLKRKDECGKKSKGEFCKELKFIEEIIQDDGLIFAKGEKEDLGTDHGRIYCSYLLLRTYLGTGKVLSRHSKDFKMQGIHSMAPFEQKQNTSDIKDDPIRPSGIKPTEPTSVGIPQSSNQGADF